ncbi:MAG: hypothetical protein GY846_18795 [Deltaproteobacteria bacterium]|nr:hypothetical protein [Deltaproteobacteria bacterium]
MERILLEGNEAVAWGAYRMGCRFFAGYPITPATSFFNTMLKILPPAGGTVLQAVNWGSIGPLWTCGVLWELGEKALRLPDYKT